MTDETNSGYRNSGDCNSGDMNSGDMNSGDMNSGNCNSGNMNSGDCNSGDMNSGNMNSGAWNSGNRNSGAWNSGDMNSGDCNSGDMNSGNMNSGYFCTNAPPVRMFNRDTDVSRGDIVFPDFFYFELNNWICQKDMTDEEKAEHPLYETTDGYLKTVDYKEAWKNAWDSANKEDRDKVFDLPNFNADIFLEITGINVRKSSDETIELMGKKYNKAEIENALKDVLPID